VPEAELVLPQWPRCYPKFAEMNDGYTGQRFERTEYVLAKGPDERYQEVWDLQKVATVGIPNKSIPCGSGTRALWATAG
jgi:hypothetical protein